MDNIFISSDQSSYDINTDKSISESNKSSTSYVASENNSEANEVYSNMVGGAKKPLVSPEDQKKINETAEKVGEVATEVAKTVSKGVENVVGKVTKDIDEKYIELTKELKEMDCNYVKYYLAHISDGVLGVAGKTLLQGMVDEREKFNKNPNNDSIYKKWSESPEAKQSRKTQLTTMPSIKEEKQNREGELVQLGGNQYNIEPKKYRKYYEKYLKYKLKYLELKYD